MEKWGKEGTHMPRKKLGLLRVFLPIWAAGMLRTLESAGFFRLQNSNICTQKEEACRFLTKKFGTLPKAVCCTMSSRRA